MTRVVVIGGGIAGYCAALGARREGAEVTVAAFRQNTVGGTGKARWRPSP